jgi:hypothetical protein
LHKNHDPLGYKYEHSRKIALEIEGLASEDQAEVLDFVQFIKNREKLKEERNFKYFSLAQAMGGMEDEPDLYGLNDVREILK